MIAFQAIFHGSIPCRGNWEYVMNEQNSCIKCSCKNTLTVHHVYPRCFAKYDKDIHSTVKLCETCHTDYEQLAQELKQQLCLNYTGSKIGEMPKNYKTYINHISSVLGYEKGLSVPKVRYIQAKHYCKNFKLVGKMASLFIARQFYCIYLSIGKIELMKIWQEHFNRFLEYKPINLYYVVGVNSNSNRFCGHYVFSTNSKQARLYNGLRSVNNLNCIYPG